MELVSAMLSGTINFTIIRSSICLKMLEKASMVCYALNWLIPIVKMEEFLQHPLLISYFVVHHHCDGCGSILQSDSLLVRFLSFASTVQHELTGGHLMFLNVAVSVPGALLKKDVLWFNAIGRVRDMTD